MPQLDISTWPPQLFWLAVTFFALYFVISRVAIPRTGGVIALRNPAAAASQRGTLFLGFAFAEATGLIGFAVAMLILFG